MKIGIAIVWFFCLLMSIYAVLHNSTLKANTYTENVVFVWGDSQMYQGLNDSLLGKELGKQILSSAIHGSGIYDFLVSEKSIPKKATCILAFPECALLRNPLLDYNRTGFELGCLIRLFGSGCPIQECLKIEKLNRGNINYNVFGTDHSMYPYSNIIVCQEQLSSFCGMFSEEKDYFDWKAKSYEMGIQNLYDKHNQIILVQFPFEQQVENCARNSINRYLTDSLKFEIIDRFAMKYDTIVLHSDSLLMHDLSHMNEVGARLFTFKIAEILSSDTMNNYFMEVMIQ